MNNINSINYYIILVCAIVLMFTEVSTLMKDICSWLQSNVWLPYSLNQMPQLLFISSCTFVRLLCESGYYSRAAFIKLRTEDEEIQQGGVAADAR